MDLGRARLTGVPIPLLGAPTCELKETARCLSPSGCTFVAYEGSDGNEYHLLYGLDGRVWLVTYRSP